MNQKLKELEHEGPMFLVANGEGGASAAMALIDGFPLVKAPSEQEVHCHFNLAPGRGWNIT